MQLRDDVGLTNSSINDNAAEVAHRAKKGYYCLIQFCPDRARAEAINLGVLLFCPEVGFLDAHMTKSNRRAEKLVGKAHVDHHGLNAAKRALQNRLEVDCNRFRQFEDLERFAHSRGNVLKLTSPRPVTIVNPSHDLDLLFEELVGGASQRSNTASKPAMLENVFHRLHREGRAELNLKIKVPLIDRLLHVPYAYRNGSLNLVVPHRFSRHKGQALDAATKLALDGDLISRHRVDEEMNSQLIVVSSFRGDDQSLQDRVDQLLKEYRVAVVSESQVGLFIERVEREAHG